MNGEGREGRKTGIDRQAVERGGVGNVGKRENVPDNVSDKSTQSPEQVTRELVMEEPARTTITSEKCISTGSSSK